MKKAIFSLVALMVTFIIFAGCTPVLTKGEVVKKEFTPAHMEVRVIPYVISNGDTLTTHLIPYVFNYPDRFDVTIQDWDEAEGKMRTATYRVTEYVYNAVDIGDEFAYDTDYEPDYPEYTRERKDEEDG